MYSLTRKTVLLVLISIYFFLSSDAYALCVKVPVANLRSGPGTKFDRIWKAFKYTPLEKITRRGQWYKVKDVDGDIQWIHRKLVTDRYRCAMVKVDKANIRRGPGTRFKTKPSPLSPAMRYESFKVLKTKGSWVEVIDEFGDIGWIHRKLLWIR